MSDTIIVIDELQYDIYDDGYMDLDVYGKTAPFEWVTNKNLIVQHRWFNTFSRVAKHKLSGRYFRIHWNENASESQDGQELDPPSYEEVFPHVVETIDYRGYDE